MQFTISSAGWKVACAPGGARHVIPLNDLREHQCAANCWCRPSKHEGVLVHHSVDRREEFERGRRAS